MNFRMNGLPRGRRAGVALAIAGLVGVTALSGCSSSSTPAASSAPATSAAPTGAATTDVAGKRVVIVSCGDVNPWCAIYNKTIIAGLEAKGVKVEYLQDPFDSALQIQHLQSAIASKPDLILLEPDDDKSLVPSMLQAKAAGIPIIYNNSHPADAAKDAVISVVNADQAALGTFAAQNCVEGMKAAGFAKGNVIALTGADATATSQDRVTAFKAELAKTPEFTLVSEQNGNWDPALTGKLASQLFAEYANKGGIQCAYGMADYQANAIVQAAQQAGLPVGAANKGLIVTGSNCFKVGIDNIKAGTMYGTATQAPDTEGNSVVNWTLKFLGGETIPAQNLTTEFRVTMDTLADHEAECTKA
ncbi:MAG: sugar ABC transporter substrate-binding protein [Actinomycetes bacterium]